MKKKLIEVALPLEAINSASQSEQSPFVKGHPRGLHVWWARRPLAACRAVIFASLVDDPSSRPDLYETKELQDSKRDELLALMADLVTWKNADNPELLERARQEIKLSIGEEEPVIFDPFCGRGSIPIEAQRLGFEAYGNDLNPIATLIT